jgi:hypothetical protein
VLSPKFSNFSLLQCACCAVLDVLRQSEPIVIDLNDENAYEDDVRSPAPIPAHASLARRPLAFSASFNNSPVQFQDSQPQKQAVQSSILKNVLKRKFDKNQPRLGSVSPLPKRVSQVVESDDNISVVSSLSIDTRSSSGMHNEVSLARTCAVSEQQEHQDKELWNLSRQLLLTQREKGKQQTLLKAARNSGGYN